MSQLPSGQIPPPGQTSPISTPPTGNQPPAQTQGAKQPEGQYGFDQATYDAEFARAQEYVASRDAARGATQPSDDSRPRNPDGTFASTTTTDGEPAVGAPPAFDPRLVATAREAGITDLTGIADNHQLNEKVKEKRVTAARELSRVLGYDVSEIADFIQSKRAAKPQEAAPQATPVAAPVAEPRKPFELKIKDEELQDPVFVEVAKALAAEVIDLRQQGLPKAEAERIAALEKKIAAYEKAQQDQQTQDMASAFDEAAEATGLDKILGCKPSATLNAVHPGWAGFMAEFFVPVMQEMVSHGHPDNAMTAKTAMAQAKALAQQTWAARSGQPQQTQSWGTPNTAQQMPPSVIRSEPRTTPYQGTTYAPNDVNRLFDPNAEQELWARNGGRNPHAGAYR